MGCISFVFSYRALAVVAIVGIGATVAVTLMEETKRYLPVRALVDGQDMDGLGEVVAMEFVDDRVYLLSHGDHCLTVLSQGEDGTLKLVEHLARAAFSPVPAGARKLPVEQVFGINGQCIRRTKDGRFLFVAGAQSALLFEHGEDKSLNVVSFHGLSGRYDPQVDPKPRVGYVLLALSPDERYLFSNWFEVLRFDRDAKRMERLQLVEDVGPCNTFCMSPDGRNLYGTSTKSRLLYVFSIDPENGHLTKVQELDKGQCGVRAVQVISSLEPSPDGSVVIATCPADQGEVSVLHRDSDSGKLSVAQVLSKEKSKIDDLVGPHCCAFSRDGATLYVGCTTSDSVVVLRKDPKTDTFSYLETIKDPSVKDPTCLALNGRYLFVCSREPGTLTVFRINEGKDKPKTKVQEEQTTQ